MLSFNPDLVVDNLYVNAYNVTTLLKALDIPHVVGRYFKVLFHQFVPKYPPLRRPCSP